MQAISLVDLISKFDQFTLNMISRDLTKFQILLKLLRNCTIFQKKTNLVAQFQQVMNLVLDNLIPEVARVFMNNISMKDPLSYYKDEEILLGICQYILEAI